MSDQCRNCVVCGDLKQCEETPCNHHDNWYPMQLKARIKELEDRRDDLEQTLCIVYFSNDIKDHLPETHRMVERALKEPTK